MNRSAVIFLTLASFAIGGACSSAGVGDPDPAAQGDPGKLPDAGTTKDAPEPFDGATPLDAAKPLDAATPLDADLPLDAAADAAADAPSDANTPMDADTPSDSGMPADSGTSPDGPKISGVTASDITQTSALISWKLSEPGTGQVEYGTTTAYGKLNTPELSFNYSAHAQPLTGLGAGTLYHFRVRSKNQAGFLSISGDSTFTTTQPAMSTGNLPAKVVGGYFTTWQDNGSSLKSIVDSTNYNLIYVAFATGTNASSGSLQLSVPPGATSAADVKSQIAYANSKGKKVLISVGGYFDLGGGNSGYVLDSTAKVDQLMVSMHDFHDNWGFNGMDWDLEHGDRPDVAGIVDASKRMRADFGPTWIINSAPGAGLATWVGAGGVLDTLGVNGWDAVGEQIYDLNLSPDEYRAKIVSRMTTLSKKYGADKVVLGNKYRQDSPSGPYEPMNYVPIATTVQALGDLRGAGINLRGSFVWTIQSDSDQAYAWSSGVGGDILAHPLSRAERTVRPRLRAPTPTPTPMHSDAGHFGRVLSARTRAAAESNIDTMTFGARVGSHRRGRLSGPSSAERGR